MAKIIDDADFGVVRRKKYPWDEWLDGQARELTRGIDFDNSVKSMQNTFLQAAMTRSLIGQTRVIDENRLLVRATKRETP
jgi:hypothetical protein